MAPLISVRIVSHAEAPKKLAGFLSSAYKGAVFNCIDSQGISLSNSRAT